MRSTVKAQSPHTCERLQKKSNEDDTGTTAAHICAGVASECFAVVVSNFDPMQHFCSLGIGMRVHKPMWSAGSDGGADRGAAPAAEAKTADAMAGAAAAEETAAGCLISTRVSAGTAGCSAVLAVGLRPLNRNASSEPANSWLANESVAEPTAAADSAKLSVNIGDAGGLSPSAQRSGESSSFICNRSLKWIELKKRLANKPETCRSRFVRTQSAPRKTSVKASRSRGLPPTFCRAWTYCGKTSRVKKTNDFDKHKEISNNSIIKRI